MYEIAELAGFCAAHGIWSVSDSDVLIPLIGYVHADGTKGMERFLDDDVADSAVAAEERLADSPVGWLRAVLVVDAYLHLDRGRTDALMIKAVEFSLNPRSMRIAVPYRHHSTAEGFAVYRPKFMEAHGFGDSDFDTLGAAFYAGVDSHEKAAAVWNAHLLNESA
ncbi:hypothetical protein [Nocardia sp. NPDC056100]|uniref:hypothetical protein n=1 Tax=Nocardia sp. NPDC056100 TaxID=3345712 RepID=UPI0035DF2472